MYQSILEALHNSAAVTHHSNTTGYLQNPQKTVIKEEAAALLNARCATVNCMQMRQGKSQ